MKLLIISDIHGSAERLAEVLETPYPYDLIALVGDSLYHGPRNPILSDYNPQSVSEQLNKLTKPIVAVRGNCDAEVDQMLLHFPMMQDYCVFNVDTVLVYLTHGHLADPDLQAENGPYSLHISGHTHVPIFKKIGNTFRYNPGSIALPKEDHPATYGYLDGTTLTTYRLDHTVYTTHTITL